MRNLSSALVAYSNDHRRYFPHVDPDQPAGIYAVRLVEGEYLERPQTMQMIVCPASAQAEMIKKGDLTVHIPKLTQVARDGSSLPPQVRLNMGGTYAYRVGYTDNGIYVFIRNRSDCRSPILSDAPSRDHLGDASPHHGGGGQNVLFEDGHVEYVVGYLVPAWDNHMFLNNHGQPATGEGRMDAVLMRSEMTPGAWAVPVDRQ
jgi:hypothetical protein